MRRTVLTVLLATVAALPTAGHATTGGAAGVCGISGTVTYTPSLKTLPAPVGFIVSGGTLTCVEHVRADNAGVGLTSPVGFFDATGSGSIGCAASQGAGSFEMGIKPRIDSLTQDLWTGTFTNAGTATQALVAKITGITHQTRPNSTSNTWTATGSETVVAGAAAGEFIFGIELDDVNACGSTSGISSRSFLGNLAYSYVTS